LLPGSSGWAFLVDENTAKSLAFALRAAGYVAEHVYEVGLQGYPDTEIFAYAQAHQRTIITADLDFAQIPHFPPPHFGIMVLRLPDTMPTNELAREVLNALAQLAGQSLANTLFIAEPGRIRKRM
jgi:predicted nuclease of predicted toxin-antitoxin system